MVAWKLIISLNLLYRKLDGGCVRQKSEFIHQSLHIAYSTSPISVVSCVNIIDTNNVLCDSLFPLVFINVDQIDHYIELFNNFDRHHHSGHSLLLLLLHIQISKQSNNNLQVIFLMAIFFYYLWERKNGKISKLHLNKIIIDRTEKAKGREREKASKNTSAIWNFRIFFYILRNLGKNRFSFLNIRFHHLISDTIWAVQIKERTI